MNVYQKDPLNQYHWRANLARPARDIDLPPPTRNETTSSIHVAPPQSPQIENASEKVQSPDDEGESDSLEAGLSWGNDGDYDDYGNYSEDCVDKDFTACDRECGHCGRCPY